MTLRKIIACLLGILVLLTMFVGCSKTKPQSETSQYNTVEDLTGKRLGIVTGSVFDQIAKEKVPGNKAEYFNSMSDLPTALRAGKIDAYLSDEPIFRNISRNYQEEYIIEQLTSEDYAFLFPKDSEKHMKICEEMNEFLAECWNDGTIDELCDKWINGDYQKASVDFNGLTGEKGTLKMAISSEIGAPFTFMQNNKFAGYDVEVAVRFCRKYGYALEISDYSVGGFLSATSTGNADLAAGCVSVTPERKESILFSEPDYHGGIVLVGAHTVTSDNNGSAFFSRITESFRKTFIRENRWKLFLDGIGITLVITALSVVLGTLIGFLLFLLYRKNFKPFIIFVDIIKDILEKTPIVVILMILYYIVFGKSNLSGVLVSVIGFTLMFAFSLVETLRVGVTAVDKGQSEAALAMGFTDLQGFFKVILPQAAKHFLPGYKGQIVALLKNTAIVGYIAVQDLTKISDIVRSRTYEAFFPLIATAGLYFLLAWLLTLLVRLIEIKTDTKKRSKKKILRGVKTK
ncbi:MAG: transporter substrate-binding domain-containing protein [Ruminococcus sp.]|nr:transporter substrate-binding domain-containing protein [Candidatus Copronaster equi]